MVPPKKVKKSFSAPKSLPVAGNSRSKTAREERKRTPLMRMLSIHDEIARGCYPNSTTLSKRFGVSGRTVTRDIDFMRDTHKLPIAYDDRRYGFYYTKKNVVFPNLQLTTGEVMGLCVAHMAIEPYRGTAIEQQLRSALERITRGMTDEVRVRWDELASIISFRGNGGEVKIDMEIFQSLSEASVACEEVEFFYIKIGSTTEKKHRVRPYHITCLANIWYLLSIDAPTGEIRTFALNRMCKLRRTGVKFERDENFRPEEYLTHSIGIFSGGKPEHVHLRATGIALRIFQERRWHGTQKVVTSADGKEGEVTMEVAITPELERFILSWGSEVRVLAPASLVKTMKEMTGAMAGCY